jgi:endonuclease-3
MKKKDIATEVFQRLIKVWPNAYCELKHETPFQLLIATILSAQCTDERVNKVTPNLFQQYSNAHLMAKAKLKDLEELIKSTGFYKNKAKSILETSKILSKEFNGEVPPIIDELIKLPGVGRKTANVVLGNSFHINEGIVVDTHVKRITKLIGLTKNTDPLKIEQDLIKYFPKENWTQISHLLIFLGRRVCIARRPDCKNCYLNDICESSKV